MTERFELPAELNIYSAPETREALLSWSAGRNATGAAYLWVSARDVAEVDGSGLQLLASFGNMEPTWRLVDASAAFQDACNTLGFGHWLNKGHLQNDAAKA